MGPPSAAPMAAPESNTATPRPRSFEVSQIDCIFVAAGYIGDSAAPSSARTNMKALPVERKPVRIWNRPQNSAETTSSASVRKRSAIHPAGICMSA